MRLTMATKRSYRWLYTLHLAPMLPDNTGDWMSCPNGHPLQIFTFLPTSGRSRLRIPTALLPGLAHDQIPHPEHHELLLSSCRVYVTYIPLSWLPNAIKMNYNYFFCNSKRDSPILSRVWNQVYLFLLILSSWLEEIARVLLAYQYLILLWISFFSS